MNGKFSGVTKASIPFHLQVTGSNLAWLHGEDQRRGCPDYGLQEQQPGGGHRVRIKSYGVQGRHRPGRGREPGWREDPAILVRTVRYPRCLAVCKK